ncbi:MAG: DUF6524 family protein [Gammaproteobacteria bacterium]
MKGMAMEKQGVTPKLIEYGFGVFVRFLMALVLVYATYNPEGWSYFHWAERAFLGAEGSGSPALLFLAGTVLLIGWVVFLNATRRSLGLVGVVLAVALCSGVIWLFIEWDVVSADNVRALQHLALWVVSAILAVGMSWAHLRQRLTGQVSTDEVD